MGTIIHFLAMKGFQINSSPNTKLTMEMYDMLAKEYKGEREAKIEAQKARHMTYLGGSVTVESIVDTENGVANNKGKGEGESISIQGKDISGEDSTGTLIEEKEETIGDIKITGYVKDLIESRKRKKEKAVVKIKETAGFN